MGWSGERTHARAFLELLRPANVTTALGDVLAGYAIAGLGNLPALPWLLGATVCLYAGGVVLNDVFDFEIDRRERPERPLPSGRIGRGPAAARQQSGRRRQEPWRGRRRQPRRRGPGRDRPTGRQRPP